MKKFIIIGMLFSAVAGGIIALGGYLLVAGKQPLQNGRYAIPSQRTDFAEERLGNFTVPQGLNFVLAAAKATPAVVHIKTFYQEPEAGDGSADDIWEWFRKHGGEEGDPGVSASGSGVIISENGYIITNFHVIEDAHEIRVVLENKKDFKGRIIGSDPATDLALIKIEAEGLPFLEYGNSDDLKVGEWVLAVGNPFDLTSTVTAGIVSAKSRNINILESKDNLTIESFIQTDAAVNPGNSGGALVNLKGELVGINTAIASGTGTFSGYSFAVPVSIASKIAEDLLRYGEVQRALLGVRIRDIDADLKKAVDVVSESGVYLSFVEENSAAEEAGMKVGDVITKVNEKVVNTVADLQETVARYRPGDRLKIICEREGKAFTFEVVLRNKFNGMEIVSESDSKPIFIKEVGAEIRPLNEEEKKSTGLISGLKVVKVVSGRFQTAKIPEGFVITRIDKKEILTADDLRRSLENKTGGVLVEGIDVNGKKAFYGLGF